MPVRLLAFVSLLGPLSVAAACDEGPSVVLDPDAPEQVPIGEAVDLPFSISGAVSYPIRAELDVLRCPTGATCTGSETEFAEPAEPHVFEEALRCDLVTEQWNWYTLSVYDEGGLTTQPASVGFECVE